MKPVKVALISVFLISANLNAISYSTDSGVGVFILTTVKEDEKTEFRKSIDQKVDALNKKVRDIKHDIKKAGKKADADFREENKKLNASRMKIKKKLNAIGDKSKTDWENAKKDIETETEKFQNKVEEFINKHKI